jgi:deazaflavin-dependent oxidoreductase (nitroreductase family)
MSPEAIHRVLGDAATIDITTTGRHSGDPRRIEIWVFRVDGRYVITGTPGPRDWYANVLADPRLVVHAGGLDLTAVARPVADATLRRSVFEAPHTSWYLTQTPLEDLVATSPMVELDFSPPDV